jgi:RND family efflux transporter MFP subunit
MKKAFARLSLLFIVSVLFSCAKNKAQEAEKPPIPVRIVAVTTRETAEELKGFGSLSFLKKFELVSPVEGVLDVLNFREGDSIVKGDLVGVLKNPQVNLTARRAEDAWSQARAAVDLSAARLREGEFSVEARLLENEKSGEELAQALKMIEEEGRKNLNREILFEAGGLSEEAIREERFRLASAEAQILIMEKELEIRRVGLREEDLAAAGILVPVDRDELRRALVMMATSALRAEASAARANLEAASREMESCRYMETELQIRSPGPGIVGARYVEEGERVKRDDRIITIMDTGSLYAIFPVPEAEALKLKKGMPARISSGGEESYEGKVDLVSPQADNQSFTFMVRILLDSGCENTLKPGMFARIYIPMEEPRKMTVIPEAALAAKKESSGKVFTVQRGNAVSEKNVTLGVLLGNEREIVSGLAPGEVVVLGPDRSLREGAYVSMLE